MYSQLEIRSAVYSVAILHYAGESFFRTSLFLRKLTTIFTCH